MRSIIVTLLSFASFGLLAQNWAQIGPYGGYFKDFIIHPTTGAIYTGSDDGGGVWKSEDSGISWTILTADFPNMTGWKLHINELNDDAIYACDVYSRYGLLISTDAGDTWTISNSGLDSDYDKMVSGIVSIDLDSLMISTGEAAASTPPRPGNGMFKSVNGGDSWTEAGLQGITVPCVGKNAFNTIFAGTEGSGLYYTNDFGDNWLIHPGIPSSAKIHEIDVWDNVVAVAAVEGIFLSSDYGITFTNTGLVGDINFDLTIHSISPEVEIFNSTFSGLQYYSTGTSSWTPISHAELDGQLIIGIESNGSEIYAGRFSNSLILKSIDNGSNWTTLDESPKATEINDLYVDPENQNHILTSMMGSYNIGATYNKAALRETNDGGLSWEDKGPSAHGLSLTSDPSSSSTLYLGTFSSGLFKSTDYFDSYAQLISGNKLIADVAINPENPDIVVISQLDLDAISVSILKSSNGGIDFYETAAIGANRIRFNMDFPDTLYAGTNDGIQLSVDMGENWSPWLLGGENILSLLYSNKKLYAGTSNGDLYKIVNEVSTNIPVPWTTPSELKSIHWTNGKLFVGLNGAEKDSTYNLSGSMWMSSDDGNSWTEITDQMSSTNVYGNNTIESDGVNLYVGTYGGGVYKSTDIHLSAQSNFYQPNFLAVPNPAVDEIILKDLHCISNAAIITQFGQQIPLSQEKISFSHEGLRIDLSELESGIYFLKIDNYLPKRIIISK